jgi:hypothetical protein
MVSFMLSTLDGSKDILLFAFKIHANLVINTSCILLYLSKALYIECNHRLQELFWVNWFKARFFGSWLRSWSFRFFLCNLCFASLFYPCIVSSHIRSFANLAEYPPFKPTLFFVLTSLTYLPITWVWRWHVKRRCFKGKIQVPSHQDNQYLP